MREVITLSFHSSPSNKIQGQKLEYYIQNHLKINNLTHCTVTKKSVIPNTGWGKSGFIVVHIENNTITSENKNKLCFAYSQL